MNEETKVCKMCGKEKYVSEFYNEDGGRISTICKECTKAQRIKSPRKAVKRDFLRIQTLCWKCKNAVGKCSWTEIDYTKQNRPIKFQPVDGWEAIETKKGRYKSYCVIKCPKFDPDEYIGGKGRCTQRNIEINAHECNERNEVKP